MTAPSSEADARILIDDLLRVAGWNPADKSQVRAEVPLSESFQVAEAGMGGSGMRTADAGLLGFADYVLLDQRGRPLAVVEAKKQAINPYTAKQQALPYAKQIGAPFIFLTNGELIYFWDYQNDDARIVNFVLLAPRLGAAGAHARERKPLADDTHSGHLRPPGRDTLAAPVPKGGDAGARPRRRAR